MESHENSSPRQCIVRDTLPSAIQDWIQTIENDRTKWRLTGSPQCYQVEGSEDIALKLTVDWFEFLPAIRIFPEEYQLYAVTLAGKTVTFQCHLDPLYQRLQQKSSRVWVAGYLAGQEVA